MSWARRAVLPLGVVLVLAASAWSASAAVLVWPEPAHGPIVDVAEAPVVVVGTVGKSASRWNAEGTFVHTFTEFRVTETQKGHVSGAILVRTDGGTVGAVTQRSTHQATFREGETARLFLSPIGQGVFEVFGLAEGKQRPVGDEDSAIDSICGSGYCIKGVVWRPTSLPLEFRVNSNTADVSGEATAIAAGYETWEADSSTFVTLSHVGSTSATAKANDGSNVVFFKSTSDNFLAEATTWSWNGWIYEGDVQFNDRYTWATSAVDGKYDIQSVAAHESGHNIGFDHTNTAGNIMYPTLADGTLVRSRGAGDNAGLDRMYTNDAPRGDINTVTCSAVDGWAFDPDEKDYSIGVRIVVDSLTYSDATDVHRSDVNSAYGITGEHGFSWGVPSRFYDNAVHSVKLYPVNLPSGTNPLVDTRSYGPCGVPSPPRNVVADGALVPGFVNVTWSPPSSNGGFPLEGYKLYVATASEGPYSFVTDTEDYETEYSYLLDPNNPSVTYYFRVRAANEVGLSAESGTGCGYVVPELALSC